MANMTVQKFRNQLRGLVDRQAKVGMILTLGDTIHTCIGTEETAWGTAYVFDSGLSLTKSNIVADIVKYAFEGKNWDFQF